VLCSIGVGVIFAGSTAESQQLNLADSPLFLTQNPPPLNLLVLGRDHKLYVEAYNDHADLDNDTVIDIKYKPNHITYFGYFDSFKCYSYDTSNNRFVPQSITSNKQCSGLWSGDWLNYVTTSRMDALRKVLYGGRRSTDSSSTTVLERSHIPQDAHSWAKEYTSITNDGYDISQYTPFAVPTTGNRHLFANVTLMLQTAWTDNAPNSTNRPRLRVALNQPYTAANWASVESPDSGACASTNDGQCSGHGGSGVLLPITDYLVRVQVCTTGLLESNCQQYPNGNYKPVGLLQRYGENGAMMFGLLTGSYQLSKSGGVLRKNIGSITDEINVTTDGTFTSTNGIIKTIDALRAIGYTNYRTDSWYRDTGASPLRGAGVQYAPGLVPTRSFNEGEFGGIWGNPVAEMMYEGLRYFAGQTSPTTAFDYGTSSSTFDAQLGLPRATWTNPYSGTGVYACSKPFELVMSDINTSYDTDQLPGVDANFGSGISNTLPGSFSASAEASTIWNAEIGAAGSYFIGQSGANYDGAPTAKSVSSFASLRGLVPEEPTKQGGYYAASVANYGITHDITTTKPGSQNVQTFVVALASSLPRIEIPVNGQTITLIPFGKSVGGCAGAIGTKGGFQATNQIVDFYFLQQPTASDGSFQVNYEDQEAGNDYDMDAITQYTWHVNTNGTVTITTTSTYAAGCIIQHMGYVISGTTQDGVYLEVRDSDTAAGSDVSYFLDTPNPKTPGQCDPPTSCAGLPLTSSRTFTPGATAGATILKDPLWYAAKWGGFKDQNNNGRPDLQDEWDADHNSTPDNYFLVTNALTLGTHLANAFNEIIARVTSASSASVNSGSVSSSSRVYQARFNSANWTGELLSYQVNPDGSLNTDINDPNNWEASQRIPAPSSRQIITTNSNGVAVPFQWANLDTTRRTQLNANATVAQNKLNYLRGDASQEVAKGGAFRNRLSRLGDIVNSVPVFVGAPPFTYPDTLESQPYSAFRTAQKNRTSVVYAGANDGMLHAYRADNGTEIFGFIPGPVFAKLTGAGVPSKDLTSPSYTHQFFVDGVATMGDVFYNNAWHTVLVGGLNKGGQGFYALDITDPTALTEAGAANIVLWQLTDANDADLGYTFSQPSIVRLSNGKWAAIFGNGYNNTESDGYASTTGYAALYIVDIQTGSVIRKITTEAGSGAAPNGLATPAVVDFDGDSIVDYVFAGDLLGNLWKFDIRDPSAANWKVAYTDGSGKPLPLYVAKDSVTPTPNRQPITERPEVGLGPQGVGMMVLFGTGKYLESTDKLLTPRLDQSFYGILDCNTGTSSDIVSSGLQQQTIDFEGSTTIGTTSYHVRLTSNNPVNIQCNNPPQVSDHRGWYMNLVSPTQGYQAEKQVSRPLLRNGRIIFTTLIPDSDPCSFGGNSWLMELDALTGKRLQESPFDLERDNQFTTEDMVEVTLPNGTTELIPASGLQSTVGIIPKPGILVDPTQPVEYKYTPGTSGDISVTVENPGASSHGRQAWRQLQ
jgi:type IV pilus assembly protein PilY1